MSTAEKNLSFFPGIGDEVIVGGFAALVLVYFLYQIVIFILEAVSGSSTEVRTEELSSGRVRANNHDCSICLGEASYAIETNWCVQELNFRFCTYSFSSKEHYGNEVYLTGKTHPQSAASLLIFVILFKSLGLLIL